MAQLIEFIESNLWLCLIVGVIAWIVADELFGISRGMFGDEDAADTYGLSRRDERAEEKMRREAEADFPEESDNVPVEDFLTPTRRD